MKRERLTALAALLGVVLAIALLILLSLGLFVADMFGPSERFEAVETGMTEEEVRSLLGDPLETIPADTELKFQGLLSVEHTCTVTGRCFRYPDGFYYAYVSFSPEGTVEWVRLREEE